jgi:large subunit ribosomal protein L17
MFRNMVTSLFKHERIRTTDAKAKEIRRWADKLVTLAKRGDLHARRQAMAIIREKDVVHKLFTEAPERFGPVSGGYTRVVKVGFRPGDAASISMVELVTPEVQKKKARRKKKTKTAVATSPTAQPAVTQQEAPAEAATPEAQAAADESVTAEEETPAEAETEAAAVETAAVEAPPEGSSDEAPPAAKDEAGSDETPQKDS